MIEFDLYEYVSNGWCFCQHQHPLTLILYVKLLTLLEKNEKHGVYFIR